MQASLYMIVILVVFQSFTLASNLATESPGMEITPRQKESLEKSILSLLGLTKRPPPVDPSKIVIPDSMRQRYDDRMRDNRETPVNFQRPGLYTRSADTVRSFTHTEGKVDERFKHHHRFRLFFDLSAMPASEMVKFAELELTRDPVTNGQHQKHQVSAFDILRPGVKNQSGQMSDPLLYMLDTKTVQTDGAEKITLDIMTAVKRWMENPTENYGILMQVSVMQDENNRSSGESTHHHIRLRRSVEEPFDQWMKKQPILTTYADDDRPKQRTKRDTINRKQQTKRPAPPRQTRRRQDRDLCQRKSLHIDFKKIGWSDWIVSPEGYDAFKCHGSCHTLTDHMNSTNHANVQLLISKINGDLASKPCCTPVELNPITFLILDNGIVTMKSIRDMQVVACGCR